MHYNNNNIYVPLFYRVSENKIPRPLVVNTYYSRSVVPLGGSHVPISKTAILSRDNINIRVGGDCRYYYTHKY